MIGILPTELVEYTLTFCQPKDVAAFSQTCQQSRALIYESDDQFLWRELFLAAPFDDPIDSPNQDPELPRGWKGELQARIQAEALVTLSYEDMRARDHDSISNAFDTLVRVLHATSPGKVKNLDWLASTAAKSFVFNDYDRFPRFLSNTQPVHQLLLLSWDLSGFRTSKGGLRGRILDDARYFVYNLSKYSVKSNWGAFCLSGSEGGALMFTANWEHIRHCVHILQLRGGDVEFPPYDLCNAIAYSAPGSHSRASDDWAGVEGVWMRDVRFLDYGTLIDLNATADEYGNLSPYEGEFLEGFTRFQVAMKIVRDLKPEEHFVISRRPLNADKRHPRLDFIGFGMSELSLGPEGQTALRGHVDRLVDGSILWTSLSAPNLGNWSFAGFQLGGPCSASGVVGTWTTSGHNFGAL
ncbi:hypothetical protein BJ322DRAFT_760528 [Thelephora terrestris]|uniref:F-box domain-containing protein n=1 Tax=Thelephora terrestris TaxID=56493 RepID=A0A9P6L6X2_9AGAM|nr:hypothetical protein BJ322DRAFT_760528 [Thelephora terrestris]